jgi:transcription elongation factor GreA
MANQGTFLTPEGYQKLEEELQFLTTVRRAEVAKAIHDAKMDGDVMENAGYEEAKRQQAFVEGRIMTLQALLENAVLIQSNGSSDTVRLGSSVTFVEAGWEPETYAIVGSAEADPGAGRISNESPLGKALMGHRVGDEIAFNAPNGVTQVEILAID